MTGGGGDGGTGDDPDCHKPDKGKCKDRDKGGPPDDPGHGNGRGNGNGPKDGRSDAVVTLTAAEVAASPASLPARGGAVALWLVTVAVLGTAALGRRRSRAG